MIYSKIYFGKHLKKMLSSSLKPEQFSITLTFKFNLIQVEIKDV